MQEHACDHMQKEAAPFFRNTPPHWILIMISQFSGILFKIKSNFRASCDKANQGKVLHTPLPLNQGYRTAKS